MPELLTDPRSLRDGYLEQVEPFIDGAAARLPRAEHRLRAAADGHAAGRGAVELPGASAGADEVGRSRLRSLAATVILSGRSTS